MSDSVQPHECKRPGLPVHHQSPEFAQTHVRWVSDTTQPSHPLPPPSPFAFSLSQHQGFFPMSQLFTSGGQNIGASATVLPIINRVDFLEDWLVWFPCSGRDSESPGPQLESINSSVLSLLYSPILTSIHYYWKNHSFNYMDLWWQSDVSAFWYPKFVRQSPCPSKEQSCFFFFFFLISWLQSPSAVILEPKKRKFVTASTFSSSICHEVLGPNAMILVF